MQNLAFDVTVDVHRRCIDQIMTRFASREVRQADLYSLSCWLAEKSVFSQKSVVPVGRPGIFATDNFRR